jgi:hypothetical protein
MLRFENWSPPIDPFALLKFFLASFVVSPPYVLICFDKLMSWEVMFQVEYSAELGEVLFPFPFDES